MAFKGRLRDGKKKKLRELKAPTASADLEWKEGRGNNCIARNAAT